MPEHNGTTTFTPRELLEPAMDPGWADAEDRPCLVVRLDGAALVRDHEAAVLAWLAGLPVPLVGLGSPDGSRLCAAMDVLVATDDDLDRVLTSILRNPAASAALVQVLRASVALDVDTGLAVESFAYSTLQGGQEFSRWLDDYRAGRSAPSAPPGDDDVLLLERRGERLDIVLNSTRNRNALSAAMRDRLAEAFRMVAMDAAIRRVEVRANGPCFSAGGDLTEFGTSTDPVAAHTIRMLRMPARYLAVRAGLYHFHLHGACIGAGIELPAFAARVSAAADSFFQLPEVAMGLIPGAGGCVSIARRIGRQRAAYMAITNQRIDVEQALAWGLVDAIDG